MFVIPDTAPDQKHFRGRLRGDPGSSASQVFIEVTGFPLSRE
jgi:hypothetical protein